MPPPWRRRPAPLSALAVTLLFWSTSGPPGGPSGSLTPSKMPPPRALPLAPLASTVFPLTLLLRSVVGPKTLRAPPLTSTEPRGAAASTWLLPMRLLVIVPPSNTLAPPRAVAFPAAELTSTVLPVIRTLLRVPPNSPAPEWPLALPEGPVAVAVTLLSLIESLLSVTAHGQQMSILRPPEPTTALPLEFVKVAALPEIVLLLIDADSAPPLMWTPAEGMKLNGVKSLVTVALLFVTELLLMLKVPVLFAPVSVLNAIPAASAITPWGDTAA